MLIRLALAALLCLALPAESRSQASEEGADSTVLVLHPQPLRAAQIDVPIDPAVAPSPAEVTT